MLDGTYDVEDFVSAFIRTEGPTFSLNGAWAQNIDEKETYIDFLGDKAGVRLIYGKEFKVYRVEHGILCTLIPKYNMEPMFQREIDAFLRCIRTGERLPSHIDNAVLTSKIMQAIYDSSQQGREIVFE